MGTQRHWAITHPGTRRTSNEDAFLCRPEIGLFAVADGVGGHGGGAFAATEVVKALEQIPDSIGPAEILAAVRDQLQSVHKRLRTISGGGRRNSPASTVVVLLFSGSHLACVWAGDSRAYLFRNGELLRLTSDHSMVGELVRAGRLTDAEAERHPDANIITRALGVGPDNAPLDKVVAAAEPGDRFLLCSDGLPKALSSQDIESHMDEDDPAAALLEAALGAGVKDNVTVIVAQACGGDHKAAPTPPSPGNQGNEKGEFI
ncbi:serine/threonine protein phosphatase PrpC [Methylobacterium sp. OAE515]|uniref:PP2C family protein-serine/threonine phosphatase n=1 Tax=Methylobacterium sp. OAE515 TaxID=2817895 RepID=UPI001789CA6D